MAPIQEGAQPATMTLRWWIVPWVDGRVAGTRLVRAPDAPSAERDLRENAADYGLPHASPLIGRARPLRADDELDAA